MDTGLLWFDDSAGRDLAEKVARAARRYEKRFGAAPNVCYTHAGALDGEIHVDGVRVIGVGNQLPDHFWIGQEAYKHPDDQLPLFSTGG
jgi:hypothetical protein